MGTEARKAIANTGPLLHLNEIGQANQMTLFETIIISQFVRDELEKFGIWDELKRVSGLNLQVEPIAQTELEMMCSAASPSAKFSNADLSILLLARRHRDAIVLTDDLTLRKVLEQEGFWVVGSLGILFRAYAEGRLSKSELATSIDVLFTGSTLYLSEGLKRRVLKRLKTMDC